MLNMRTRIIVHTPGVNPLFHSGPRDWRAALRNYPGVRLTLEREFLDPFGARRWRTVKEHDPR